MKCADCSDDVICLVNPDFQIQFALCGKCLKKRFKPAKRKEIMSILSSHEVYTNDLWLKYVNDGR